MLMPVRQRLGMVEPGCGLSVAKQCNLLQVHRTGLYYKPVGESEENLEMMRLLDQQYFSTPFYGCRKLCAWLNKQGFTANRKRVKRLMKLINWQTIYREPKTTISNPAHKKYPYLLKGLATTGANHVWATDITYIPMAKGFMYLTAVIDLHTRYVLNWGVSNTMGAGWCADLLAETIETYGPPKIFNTDQGSQYTSDAHIKVLMDNKVQISMDGKGRALDNIFIERLWRSVKYENVYLQSYADGTSLYKGLKKYFEFYNTERLHESLGYKTPQESYCKNKAA